MFMKIMIRLNENVCESKGLIPMKMFVKEKFRAIENVYEKDIYTWWKCLWKLCWLRDDYENKNCLVLRICHEDLCMNVKLWISYEWRNVTKIRMDDEQGKSSR